MMLYILHNLKSLLTGICDTTSRLPQNLGTKQTESDKTMQAPFHVPRESRVDTVIGL